MFEINFSPREILDCPYLIFKRENPIPKSIKCSCLLCKFETDSSNLAKHYNSKQCQRNYKPRVCEECSSSCFKRFCSLRCSALFLNRTTTKGFKKQQPTISYICCVLCRQEKRTSMFYKHKCKPATKKRSIKNDPKALYRHNCRFLFSLSAYKDWFSYATDLIKKHGWYSPSNKLANLTGCSRDHLYSVSDGYKNNIPASLLAHPANCEIVPHPLNQRKSGKSSITLEELYKRIDLFNQKYGVV